MLSFNIYSNTSCDGHYHIYVSTIVLGPFAIIKLVLIIKVVVFET